MHRPRLALPRGRRRAHTALPTRPWGEHHVRRPAGCTPPDGSGASGQGQASFSPAPGPAGRSPRTDRKAAAQPHKAQRLRDPHTPQPRARNSPGTAGVSSTVLTLHTHHSLGTVPKVGEKNQKPDVTSLSISPKCTKIQQLRNLNILAKTEDTHGLL